MTLPQGDLRLLQSPVARRLLTSPVPARFAYLALDGTPRVIPTWCHWTGDELVMPAFLSAPRVRHPARRLAALRAHPQVAVSIDTEGFPPEVLLIRGVVDVTEVDGVPSEYRAAAIRISARRRRRPTCRPSIARALEWPASRCGRHGSPWSTFAPASRVHSEASSVRSDRDRTNWIGPGVRAWKRRGRPRCRRLQEGAISPACLTE